MSEWQSQDLTPNGADSGLQDGTAHIRGWQMYHRLGVENAEC
jgi:hypothetical protein